MLKFYDYKLELCSINETANDIFISIYYYEGGIGIISSRISYLKCYESFLELTICNNDIKIMPCGK